MSGQWLREQLEETRVKAEVQSSRIRAAEENEAKEKQKRKRLDEELYSKFKGLVEGKRYFEIKDVDNLRIPYDILFVLGKKNIGKTYQIYKLMNDCIITGDKMVFGRVTRDECQTAACHLGIDQASPFEVKTFRGVMTLLNKENKEEQMGMMIPFRSCNKLGGGEFANYKYIIFDEIIPYTTQRIITQGVLENWAAFGSSVARDKKGLKIYLFGNLRNTNNDILDFYGISPSDNFRYIVRNGCRILFLNTRDLYDGFGKQEGIAQHASPKFRDLLENNAYVRSKDNLIDLNNYMEMSPSGFFTVKDTTLKIDLLIKLRHITFKDSEGDVKQYWGIKIEPLQDHHKFSTPIWSNDRTLVNTHFGVEYLGDMKSIYHTISLATKLNALLYCDVFSLELCRNLLSEWDKDFKIKNKADIWI